MAIQRRKKQDLSILNRLLDYFKYLYEQENQRNEKLTSVTNIYLVVITFAFTFLGGLLSWLSTNAFDISMAINNPLVVLLLAGLFISILLILISLIFTMLAVKVRSFERLCNPMDFASEASQINKEKELINLIIANYVVATDRNFQINSLKAKYLAYGLQMYLIGFVLLLLAIFGIYMNAR